MFLILTPHQWDLVLSILILPIALRTIYGFIVLTKHQKQLDKNL